MPPSYDIQRSWEENCLHGPRLDASPPLVPATPMKQCLGLPVRSRLGIAAGLLLNSRWIGPYARLGFDLLTYKTVRSAARPCHPLPNWVFVDDVSPPDGPVVVRTMPADPAQASSSVCFGMPSIAPGEWRPDVRRARQSLESGQLLIVSVVGTPGADPSLEALADDFAHCAAWAAAAGAQVVEANLSCPNVCSAEGTLYHDHQASRLVAERIRAAIGPVPLLLKVGTFASPLALRGFLQTVDGLASGVTLVNCISRPVLRADGQAAFGEAFRMAGVMGRAIHQPAVAAVRAARHCVESDRLGLAIAAVGGVAGVEDIADFFQAGADAVLCGSAPMYMPNLAIEAKMARPDW